MELSSDQRISKLVAAETDGVSVMTRKLNVVVAGLKRMQKESLGSPSQLKGLQCFAHRLELAFKGALRSVPYLRKLRIFLSAYIISTTIALSIQVCFVKHSKTVRSKDKFQVESEVQDGLARWKKTIENLLKTYPGVLKVPFGRGMI